MATVKVLVVAGGGGGGRYYSGGGGGGGVQYDASYEVTDGTQYTVTVGAGGAAGTTSTGDYGRDGGNSVFGTITATGGGGGVGSNAGGVNGRDGGCGGGAGGTGAGTGGTGSQGYDGGSKGAVNGGSGGGGGSAAGGSSDGTNGGNGGAGYTNPISGSTAGENVSGTYYVSGGGGGSLGTVGAGGNGGGGDGANDATPAQSGTANTGGGGGGGSSPQAAGAGGSGVVVISYATADLPTCTGGTITTSGSDTIHTFTSSGTFNVGLAAGLVSYWALDNDTTEYRQVYYNPTVNGQSAVATNQWLAQSFTTTSAFTIKEIKLKMYKIGTPTANLTFGIYATSSDKPTGAALCTGTYDPSTLTTDSAGEEITVDLGAGVALSASTVYSIRVTTTDDVSNTGVMKLIGTTGTTGRLAYYSTNSGSTWIADSDGDGCWWFETWGYLTTNAQDVVGDNDLTNTNVTYAASKINNGAVFNGSNAIFRLANVLQPTGNFSISGWVKPTDATAAATQIIVVNELTGTAGGPYNISIQTSGKLRFSVYATGTGAETYVESTGALTDNTMVFFTCVRDGTNIIIYLNGTSDNSTAWSTAQITNASNYFQVGGTQNSGGSNFRLLAGQIDELAIWDRALTSDEITALYNDGDGLQYPFPTTQNYTLTGETGTLTLTGYDAGLGMSYSLLAETGNLILRGYEAVLSYVGWKHTTKNSTTWTDTTKNTTTWTDSTKSDTTWSNQTKH
jgi:hypothetical protein